MHTPDNALQWAQRFSRFIDWIKRRRTKPINSHLNILALPALGFRSRDPYYSVSLRLAQLHSNRIRIIRDKDFSELKAGDVVVGEISFEWKGIPLKGTVSHIAPTHFILDLEPALGLEDSIVRYFRNDLNSSEWAEVPPNLLQEDLSGTGHLLRHPSGEEVYLVLSETNEILRFTFSDGSLYIDAGPGRPSHWGHIEPNPIREKPAHPSSLLINQNKALPQEFVAKMATSILNFPYLTFKQRNYVGELLQAGQPKWKS